MRVCNVDIIWWSQVEVSCNCSSITCTEGKKFLNKNLMNVANDSTGHRIHIWWNWLGLLREENRNLHMCTSYFPEMGSGYWQLKTRLQETVNMMKLRLLFHINCSKELQYLISRNVQIFVVASVVRWTSSGKGIRRELRWVCSK